MLVEISRDRHSLLSPPHQAEYNWLFGLSKMKCVRCLNGVYELSSCIRTLHRTNASTRYRLTRVPPLFLILGLLLSLLTTPTVKAQDTVTLVSNVDQRATSTGQFATSMDSGNVYAQGFHTGNNPRGYTLASIDANLNIGGILNASKREKIKAELWSSTNDLKPNSKIASLVIPSNVTTGNVSFTTPEDMNIVLSASTTYHLVLYVNDTSSEVGAIVAATFTPSNNEDPGKTEGWSISNGYSRILRSFTPSGTWETRTDFVIRIRVKGAAVVSFTPVFDPAHGTTETDNTTNITLTFDEAIKKDQSGMNFTDNDLVSILTLKTTNSLGTNIGYTATINNAKTIITIDPTSNLDDGNVYVAISSAYYDTNGHQGAQASATFTVDSTAPKVSFDPDNGDTETNKATNITLTFDEAVKKDNMGTDFENSDLASILTLKVDNNSGANIPYSASINNEKTIITIDPTSNLADGNVYVAISNAYYDGNGNQGMQASATFTVDSTAPKVSFDPDNGDTETNKATNITLTFDEAVKKDNMGTDFENSDLASILTLKVDNNSGANIPYSASINNEKTIITIDPTSNLADGNVYVAISNAYYDGNGNQGMQASATFTVDSTAPKVSFDPDNGDTETNKATNITLTFDEAVKKDNMGTDFENSDLASILTLKVDNNSGANIPYSASINNEKTIITIDPTSNLADGNVYVAISNAYYDGNGVQGRTSSATFTVDTTAPTPTFSPANGETETDNTANITLSFDEAIKKDNMDTDFIDSDLASILTLKTTNSSGANIPYTATINNEKTIITLDPTSNLEDGNVYVAISNAYYDGNGVQGRTSSATFTVDTTAPTPTFSPANGETETDNTANITLSFDEAIKKDGSNTDFVNSDLASILTFKVDNNSGANIPYSASINDARTKITLDPTSNLDDGNVYVAISNAYYDGNGIQGRASSATFTVDTTAPKVTFDPDNGNTVTDNSSNITLTFDEAIKKDNINTDFVNNDLASILTLKVDNNSGANIPYSASINNAKTKITINPTSNLEDGNVYVAISNAYYDGNGNQGEQASATFTVDTTAPKVTFDPDNGNTETDNTTNITLTFNEAIKKDGSNTDFSNNDLANILTLKVDNNSGGNIGYTATINSEKTIITINPMSNLEDGNVYVAISSAYYDGDGNQGEQASATFTVKTTAPAPVFDPANGETETDNTTNITLSFDEAIKKDDSGTDFNNTDLASILTLKTTNTSGTNIPYTATINGAKTIITINPTYNLEDGEVYVGISNAYYDGQGNQGEQASATFTVETKAPVPIFDPANGAIEPDNTTNITLSFGETIKKNDSGTDFTNHDLTSILTLKVGSNSGDNIPYSAKINSDKTIITIDPTSNLADGDVYVAISNAYYDADGNQGEQASATFTVDTTAPEPVFDPANGDTETDNTTNITLTFDEAIKKDNSGTDFTNHDLSSILSLKVGWRSGSDIAYTATINSDKTIITIDPRSNLADGDVYVAISNAYYDEDGNQGEQASATFTVDTVGPAPVFNPANGDTETDNTTNITLNFGEIIKKDDSGTDLNNNDLASILTLKTTNDSGTNIPYTATINTDKTIITINPTANLEDGDVYVAISNAYYDAEGNQGEQASATFTVETIVPTPTFSPANGETETDNTTNITLTFNEAIKKDDSGTDFSNNDLASILTLKTTNAGGTNIPYTGTINTDKTIITINPTANLADGAVYVGISNAYYDEDGNQGEQASATFTVNTNDNLATNANLNNLQASTATRSNGNYTTLNIGTFSTNTYTYTATVPNQKTHAKIKATSTSNTQITIQGSTVNNNADSQPIPLNVGTNTIAIQVTAQNGNTTKDYTIVITRKALPTLNLNATPNPVTEGNPVSITVTLSEPLAQDLSVPLKSTDDTAENTDHTTLNSLLIPAGHISSTGHINTSQDNDTDDETFTLSVDSDNLPNTVTTGTTTSVHITINDDDTPTVELSSPTSNPVKPGQTATIIATLSEPIAQDLSVPITLIPEQNTTSADYGTLNNIHIPAGQTTGSGTISTTEDNDTQHENFRVTIDSDKLPDTVTAGTTTSVRITIAPQVRPIVSLKAPQTIYEGQTATITAQLDKALNQNVTIPLIITLNNTDTTHNIQINAGNTSGTINIDIPYDDNHTNEVLIAKINTKQLMTSQPQVRYDLLSNTHPTKVVINIKDIPNLSTEHITVQEGQNDTATFTVRLSYETIEPVSIDYTTVAPTKSWQGATPATPNEDYTHTSGQITFEAGQTTKTIAVPILDDLIDEGNEHFLIKLANPQGAYLKPEQRQVHGRITDQDPLQRMWIARFGRTVGTQVTNAVSDRLQQTNHSSHITIANQRLNLNRQDTGIAVVETLASIAPILAPSQAQNQLNPHTQLKANTTNTPKPDPKNLLLNSAFHLAWTPTKPSKLQLSAWGRTSQTHFDGAETNQAGQTQIDGNIRTQIIGADASFGPIITGITLSHSKGQGSFNNDQTDIGNQGQLISTMTTISPYVQIKISPALSTWGLIGTGSGNMNIQFNDNITNLKQNPLALYIGAAGAQGILLTQAQAGLDLAIKTDALLVHTNAKKTTQTSATQTQVSRIRLLLKGGRRFHLTQNATLHPALELGLRHDSGNAENGSGLEVGGSIAYDHKAGIAITASARHLMTHTDAHYQEWGASATLRYDPGQSNKGINISLNPTFGNANSTTQQLWNATQASQLTSGLTHTDNTSQHNMTLVGQLGYSIESLQGTINPSIGYAKTQHNNHGNLQLSTDYATDSKAHGLQLAIGLALQQANNLQGKHWTGNLRASMQW